MKNGFVIVNYNDYDTTLRLLNNIMKYSIIDEIVVVDNCSTDESYKKLLEIENKKIKIILSNMNNGYAAGLNIGARYLISKYKKCNIIFSNADIIIDKEEDLKILIETLNKDKMYAIVAPVIREHEGLNRGWKIPTPLQDAILNVLWIHRYLRPKLLFYKDSYYTENTIVDAVSGCFFCMKSNALQDVGYFDENTFLYYEENIISKKLHSKDYKVILKNNISVFHNHAVTIDKNIHSIKKFKILKQSQIYFQKIYNNANCFEIILLNVTNKTTLFLLSFINFIHKFNIRKSN